MKHLRLIFICTLLCFSMLLFGCGKTYKPLEPDDDSTTVVGQIGGKDVYLDELKFAVYTCREQMLSAYGDDIFDGEDAQKYYAMLKERVYSSITADYATLLLCEESLIGLGETAVVEKVDQKMQALVDELGGMSKYKKYLKDNCLTDRLLRFSTEISLLENELRYIYIDDLGIIENDDDKLYDIIKNEFIVVRHVFLPHSEADIMHNVKEELLNGTDFGTLISSYNKDSAMTSKGQFILRGYMSDEYEQAAFSLAVGEFSEVVEDAKGVYIIERLEMSPTEIMFNFDYLKELYQTYTFYSIIDQKQATLEFIPNDNGNSYMNSLSD